MITLPSLQSSETLVGTRHRAIGLPSPPPFSSAFSSLVWPHEPEDFMQNVWLKHPFYHRGNEQRLRVLANIVPFHRLEKMLAMAHPNPIAVFFTNTVGVHEQFSVVSIEEALRHYDEGKTLYFHIEQGSVELRSWMQRTCHEMGIPNAPYRVSIFATQKAGGILPHFDANENFTIQLAGTKRWRYAQNDHLTNPTVNYFASDSIGEDMRPYVHYTLPTEMPADYETIDLHPGSMLYLPSGFWHTTNATDDVSISLNVVFPRITWADIFLRHVKQMVLSESAWRKRADGLLGNGKQLAAARSHVEALINKLADDLRHVPHFYFPYLAGSSVDRDGDPDRHTITATPKVPPRLRRNVLVSWVVLDEDLVRDPLHVQFQPPIGPPTTVEVPPVVREVCEWAGRKRSNFGLAQMVTELPNHSQREIEAAVMQLLDIGFLQCAKPSES